MIERYHNILVGEPFCVIFIVIAI